MISNTAMPRSQILLFAGHLRAQKSKTFSAQIVLHPNTQTAVFWLRGEMAKVYRLTNCMKPIEYVHCSHYTRGKERSMRSMGIQLLRGYAVLVKHTWLWNSLLQCITKNLYTAKQKRGPGSLLIHWTFRHFHCLNIILFLCSFLSSSNLLSCKAIFGRSSLWVIQLFLYGQQCISLSLSALQWYPQRTTYSQMHSRPWNICPGFPVVKMPLSQTLTYCWHYFRYFEEKKKKSHRRKLFLCPRTTIWVLRTYWAKPSYCRHTPLQSSSVNASQLVPSVLGTEIISWPSHNVRCATSLTLRQAMGLDLFYLLA